MQDKTQFQKPSLIVGLEKSIRWRRLSRISEVVEKIDVRLKSCLNIESSISPLLETLGLEAQLGKEATPSKLNGETSPDTCTFGEEIPVGIDREVENDIPVIMNQDRGSDPPPIPPMPPIDPLVRPRGLPIVVPQNLPAVDMPSHLPKFYGTKDEDPSRHMERYIERLASSLVTNPGYWLVWFPTTLEGEAYEWYRDHVEEYFKGWDQLQRELLNEFRPEVGQSTALRQLVSLKQGREEEILAYIRRFDLVCTWFVGTMLNDDTLKQFFIQGFFKSMRIRGVLERNPQTLADAKRAVRVMESLDRDHGRLWRRENELILQFIPIRLRMMMGETVKYESQVPYAIFNTGPRPLAVREPTPLLALPAPRADPHLDEVERKLGASQLGFQKAIIK